MNDMPMMSSIKFEWFTGPFAQGMSGGSHGPPHKVQLGSGNLPGNLQHSFGGPEYPPTRFNPGDSFLPLVYMFLVGCGEPYQHGHCI